MRADRGGWNATVLEFRRAASAITCFLEGRIHGLNSVSVEMENNTKHPLNILIDPLTFKSFADSSVKMIKKVLHALTGFGCIFKFHFHSYTTCMNDYLPIYSLGMINYLKPWSVVCPSDSNRRKFLLSFIISHVVRKLPLFFQSRSFCLSTWFLCFYFVLIAFKEYLPIKQ